MQRRIFIAINIDDKAKNFIQKKIQKWEESFPAKWVGKENFHITLMFLGYMDDQEIPNIAQNLQEALAGIEIFDVILNEFKLGPDKNHPKMIWLSGEQNENLIDLRHKVEEALSEYAVEKKPFKPHVTLARIPRKMLGQLPELEKQKISALVPIGSVEIMESRYENKERKYYVMESIQLS